ncbi:YqaJ viral recombinase family protein [Afifella sp. H1R]|uniref:YqaJ viral recombinase family nuclease n=1 Tax=Afifella sp. H1R TaxID=2908841 RepID=UPI001F26F8D6|nr:YqaJ viral recombinase family protein [Afifella sp. H1R]MCF1502161.1 YqaJ viral recombinase family protein [Afifella sp. H1R]
MSAVTYPVTDRATWLAKRRHSINGSEVAAVFGVSPFMTPLDLYLAKINGREIDDNALLQRGRWLEAAALAALADERPEMQCRAAGVFVQDTELRLGATPDLIADGFDGEPVEVKAPTPRVFETEWEDGPPLHYQLQALTQAVLLDKPKCWIAALVVDGWKADLRIFEIERVAAAEERVLQGVAAFWKRLENQDPPPATYGEDAAALAALYPRETVGKEIDLSGDNMLPELLDERAEITSRQSADKKRRDAIDDEIKAKLGDAERAILADGRSISWKTQHRKEVTLAATSFRVLRIHTPKAWGKAA